MVFEFDQWGSQKQAVIIDIPIFNFYYISMGCVPTTDKNYNRNTNRNTNKNTNARRSAAFNALSPRTDTIIVGSSRIQQIPLPQQQTPISHPSKLNYQHSRHNYQHSPLQTSAINYQQMYSPQHYQKTYAAHYTEPAQAYGLNYLQAKDSIVQNYATKRVYFSPDDKIFTRTNSSYINQPMQIVVTPPSPLTPSSIPVPTKRTSIQSSLRGSTKAPNMKMAQRVVNVGKQNYVDVNMDDQMSFGQMKGGGIKIYAPFPPSPHVYLNGKGERSEIDLLRSGVQGSRSVVGVRTRRQIEDESVNQEQGVFGVNRMNVHLGKYWR